MKKKVNEQDNNMAHSCAHRIHKYYVADFQITEVNDQEKYNKMIKEIKNSKIIFYDSDSICRRLE